MKERNSENETGYEFIPLPKAPEREEIPEILRDALEMKHFTLPKLPKKYRLPEVLQETHEPNTLPPVILPPTSPSHLPTKSKKVPPSYKPTPRAGHYLPHEEHDLSPVDTATYSRTKPTQHSCSSALPTHTKTSKTNKNTCTCEKCHFDFEEREVFLYLPQNLASYLREEHQSLKRQNYPTQKVIEHGKQELEIFKKYLPPHLLHKIELEHQEREQKSFAEGHVQKASSCGCASSSSQKMENASTSAYPAPYSHSFSNSSSCCNCNSRDRSRSRNKNKCCCCCCCCHQQQLIPYGGYANTPPSPTPTTPPYTPPQGQGPGLPFGGPYGNFSEDTEEIGVPEEMEGESSVVPLESLRKAFETLAQEMKLWGINSTPFLEIIRSPNTTFYEIENYPMAPFNQFYWAEGSYVLPDLAPDYGIQYDFYLTPDKAELLKAGDFYYVESVTNEGSIVSLTLGSEIATILLFRALYGMQCASCNSEKDDDLFNRKKTLISLQRVFYALFFIYRNPFLELNTMREQTKNDLERIAKTVRGSNFLEIVQISF